MSKINWSKAPEWADGHGLVAHHGITEVWINMDQYAVVGAEDRAYPYGGGTGDHRHNFTRGQVQYITPRPARWDGQGHPTAGTLCEMTSNDGHNWRPVLIIFFDDYVTLVGQSEGKVNRQLFKRCDADVAFRPLRTPEQIAAEEREEAIAEMWTTYWQPSVSTAMEGLGLLYDAGYRKQVAP